MRVLVTGGSGFIGSNFIHFWLDKYKSDEILNMDCLTYAADPKNLEGVDELRYFHTPVDIRNRKEVGDAIRKWNPHTIVHFAAESHVDRSINGPEDFVTTNVIGTFNLMEEARLFWEENHEPGRRFHHISTDEVFGSLGPDDKPFTERTSYDPSSVYSASKAGSDHLARAFFRTHKFPVTISNCSNNFGPHQHDEKLFPTVIRKALAGEPIPIYGKGENIRDWLYVEEHCKAIERVLVKGTVGETYCIGGDYEYDNHGLAIAICRCLDQIKPKSEPFTGWQYEKQIKFVEDRKGHDFRYAIDCSKMKELGWEPPNMVQWKEGLWDTIRWYVDKYDAKEKR